MNSALAESLVGTGYAAYQVIRQGGTKWELFIAWPVELKR